MKKFLALVVFSLVIAQFASIALDSGKASIEGRVDRIEQAVNAAS